ncbi:MAG: hypothetical protein QOF14_4053 [Hyphomicrobiales bacterium]|jgi:DNA-binding transcriptional LysR family regulator|nr:hypothetical protein [Hyphomicrobiales bacterium]
MHNADPLLRRLKLSDLRLFSAVVSSGGMAKAAVQLNISQPAVSKAIATLENALGVRLLDRNATGVAPTVYGEALLRGSDAVFDDLTQSVARIKFLSDPTTGKLRFGCSQPLSLGFVPTVIERVYQGHPGIRFEVVDGDAVAGLQQRHIELAITRRPIGHEKADVNEEILFDDPLVVVAASDSIWARRRRLSLQDLINEPWSLPYYNSPVGRMIVEGFRTSGLEPPKARVKTFSTGMQLGLLATGKYLAIWPSSMVRLCAARLSVKGLPVEFRHRPSPVAIMTLKNRTLSPLAELFIRFTREAAKPLRQHVP